MFNSGLMWIGIGFLSGLRITSPPKELDFRRVGDMMYLLCRRGEKYLFSVFPIGQGAEVMHILRAF
jgi:hypothetical protein